MANSSNDNTITFSAPAPVDAYYRGRRTQYPIGALLLDAWRRSDLPLGRFVSALGYRNLAGGCRAFDAWLAHGAGLADLLRKLQQSPWAVSAASLDEALNASADQRAAEQRAAAEAAFRPMVQARPELSRPTAITFFALLGGPRLFTRLLPEDVADHSEADQDALVAAFARDFATRYNGQIPFFGGITGYLLFTTFGERPWLFSTEGVRVAQVDERPVGSAVIRV